MQSWYISITSVMFWVQSCGHTSDSLLVQAMQLFPNFIALSLHDMKITVVATPNWWRDSFNACVSSLLSSWCQKNWKIASPPMWAKNRWCGRSLSCYVFRERITEKESRDQCRIWTNNCCKNCQMLSTHWTNGSLRVYWSNKVVWNSEMKHT